MTAVAEPVAIADDLSHLDPNVPCEVFPPGHDGARDRRQPCGRTAAWVVRIRFACGVPMTVLVCTPHRDLVAEPERRFAHIGHGPEHVVVTAEPQPI